MRLFLIIVFSFLSIFSFAQKKKKKLTMHEQVELAKKQMAEAEANKYSNEKPFTKLGANIPSFNVLALNEQLFFDNSFNTFRRWRLWWRYKVRSKFKKFLF